MKTSGQLLASSGHLDFENITGIIAHKTDGRLLRKMTFPSKSSALYQNSIPVRVPVHKPTLELFPFQARGSMYLLTLNCGNCSQNSASQFESMRSGAQMRWDGHHSISEKARQ
jgi:hypothetical protein